MSVNKVISNTKKVELLMQPYLSRREIALILGIGITRAGGIVKDIYKMLAEQGKSPYTPKAYLVASETFLEFMQWKLEDFIEKAKIEQELNITESEE